MKTRLILSAGLLLGLSGCATYDYVGSGSGGYYHGSPQVQRSYPYGYPSGSYGYPYGTYGYGSYGYGGYYGGQYGNYGYPYPVYRPAQRPPHNGHRPPPKGNGHVPPRPGNGQPPANGSGKAPWRDLDRLQRPQPRPGRADARPMQRNAPAPRAVAPARPAMPQRAAPERRPSQTRRDPNLRQVEP